MTSSSVAGVECCDWQYGSATIGMLAIFGATPANFTVPVTVAASGDTAAAAVAVAAVVGAAVPLVPAEAVCVCVTSSSPSSWRDGSFPLPPAGGRRKGDG